METKTNDIKNLMPEKKGASVNDFFQNLSSQMGGGFFSPEDSKSDITDDKGLGNKMQSVATDDDKTKGNIKELEDKITDWEKKYDILSKQYKDSSTEGVRLNAENEALKPLAPILAKAQTDPEYVAQVLASLESGITPVSIIERLKLDKEFVFDGDDAVKEPGSDSGKVLAETISSVVRAQLGTAMQTQNDSLSQQLEEESFKRDYKLTDDEWKEYKDYANTKKLELEDILYLKNRKSREEEIARKTREETLAKLKQNRLRPQSLATVGSEPVDFNDDIAVFNKIFPHIGQSGGGFFD